MMHPLKSPHEKRLPFLSTIQQKFLFSRSDRQPSKFRAVLAGWNKTQALLPRVPKHTLKLTVLLLALTALSACQSTTSQPDPASSASHETSRSRSDATAPHETTISRAPLSSDQRNVTDSPASQKPTFSKEIKLIAVHPFDSDLFVQGLQFDGDSLLVSTGQYGASVVGRWDVTRGEWKEAPHLLDAKYFGEGIALTNDALWQLTWKEGTAFQRDKQSLAVIKEVKYDGEGWGLCFDGTHLIMSNGSNALIWRDPDKFEVQKVLLIMDRGAPLTHINELEYVDSMIYANIWLTDRIVQIDSSTGQILKSYDLSGLLDQADPTDEQRKKADVLNGIAHIDKNRFYISGKYWPALFEVELQ